jgi:hypothetical protein
MDFVTCLPITLEGWDTIVTFVDRFTKMVHFVPCTVTGLRASKLADIFIDKIFKYHGVPSKIISDRDPKMNNLWWKEVMARLGARCRFSTAFHPETDGQSEVFNRSLQEVLRHFIAPDMTNWAELLPMVEFACNSHRHEGTKHTPFYLNYGRHPARPIDLTFRSSVPANESSSDKALRCDAEKTAEELHRAIKATEQLLLDHNSRMKQQADKKRKDHPFLEGDQCWLSSKHFSWKHGSRKLCPKYMGPFKILRAVGPSSFAIELPSDWRIYNVFHVSKLKPVHPQTRYMYPDPSKVVDGVPQWEVNTIVKHRVLKTGKIEYLVNWTGFGVEYNSWLNEDQLQGSPQLLDQYHKMKLLNPQWGNLPDSEDDMVE